MPKMRIFTPNLKIWHLRLHPLKKLERERKMKIVIADHNVFWSLIALLPIFGLPADLTTGCIYERLSMLQVIEAVVIIYREATE